MPEVVERFGREARAAARIQGEHVARVIDVGRFEDGTPFMVMEYLRGRDLAAELSQRGPLPVGEAVRYVLEASEAVAQAHAMRIVHRDLKPSNLFLAETPGRPPIVKVLDFGISKVVDAPSGSLTKTASVMGTPFYMSPEQLLSAKNVDHRSDIWSLGVIIYELLAGHPPFWGETQPEVIAKILENRPPPLRARRPDVAPLLESVVSRCLRSRVDERFSSVADLAIALLPFGGAEDRERVAAISRVLGIPTDVIAGSLAQVTLAAGAPDTLHTGPPSRFADAAGGTMRSEGGAAHVAGAVSQVGNIPKTLRVGGGATPVGGASADGIAMSSVAPPANRGALWLAALAGILTLVAVAGVVALVRSRDDARAGRIDTVSPEPPPGPGAFSLQATISPLPAAPPPMESQEPVPARPPASMAPQPRPAGGPPPGWRANERPPPAATGAHNPLDMGLK
jgi:serine/threonine-protein kinase